MAERPRAVTVGPGYIGAVHTDGLRRNGVDVVSIIGTGSETGRSRADAFRVPFFSSLADALASGLVDCVHITTRNHLHAPLARQTIAAGAHRACRQSRGVGRTPSCVVLVRGLGHFRRGAPGSNDPIYADGVRSLRVGDTSAQSARNRRWVSPSLEFDS